MGLCILRAGIMVQRVDYVLSAYPGHTIAAIFYSVVGSSGGGIVVDFFNLAGGYSKGGCPAKGRVLWEREGKGWPRAGGWNAGGPLEVPV